jgi:hypothetical protein
MHSKENNDENLKIISFIDHTPKANSHVEALPGPYGKGYPRTDESFMRARHARPLYALWVGHPPNGLTAVWGVARPQGGRLAAVFFPLGYPFAYGPANHLVTL